MKLILQVTATSTLTLDRLELMVSIINRASSLAIIIMLFCTLT